MELHERCLHLCQHIQTLTGVHTALLNIQGMEFVNPPFHPDCDLHPTACTALTTHLYGAYEAERWDGKYIYYCPRGLTFIATPPLITGEAMQYCIITGPILMTNDADDPFEDPLQDAGPLDDVPRLTTAQTRALSELAAAAVSSVSLDALPPDVDSGSQAVMLQMMYELTAEQAGPRPYPIETERRLQEHVRSGDKEAAQELLNELLMHLYCAAGNDQQVIKARIRELLIIMGRAAIDGGADIDEIFNLCCRYEQQVDSFTNPEVLNRWVGAILHKFVSFVFDFNDIKHQNVIFQTTAYIKEHLTEKLSLDQVAEQVYLSKSYFCRIIKEELGCTFTEYVNRLRIERSKALLRASGISIAEVACAVGFDDQSYFTRIFKKQTGMAPGKYRESRSKKAK